MITTPRVNPEQEAEQLYRRAVKRLETELGWSPGKAHTLLADVAAGYGVFLHDVAAAVVTVPSLKRSLRRTLRSAVFDRRPLNLRE